MKRQGAVGNGYDEYQFLNECFLVWSASFGPLVEPKTPITAVVLIIEISLPGTDKQTVYVS